MHFIFAFLIDVGQFFKFYLLLVNFLLEDTKLLAMLHFYLFHAFYIIACLFFNELRDLVKCASITR